MTITCNYCKEEVEVAPYFYDQRITADRYTPTDTAEYRAVASEIRYTLYSMTLWLRTENTYTRTK